MKTYLETLKWEVLPHLPYSLDIASSDYHLFRSMAHGLAEQHFHSYEDVKKWIDSWIASKDMQFFQWRIQMLPERWEKVTITCRQLVSHLGGIRHYYEEKGEPKKTDGKSNSTDKKEEMDLKEYYITTKYNDLQSALDMFKDDPLVENPGTKFLYSTHGWTLVSAIVEAVAKEQFTVHITKMFKTLGLNNTYLDENDVLIYNRSRNYVKNKKGNLINAPYVDNSYKWAGGGFLSTVGDLLQFANAMLYSLQAKGPNVFSNINAALKKNSENDTNKEKSSTDDQLSNSVNQKPLPGFLNSKTIEAMWEPVPPAPNYGMGWSVHLQKQECEFCKKSKFCVYHTGSAVGASSVLLIVPAKNSKNKHPDSESYSIPKGIAVAVLSNMHNVSLLAAALKISQQFDKQ
ncbi:Serine beta-lactamase-like protein LACTB, mitochondrial [Araneus ventricosus]|uniref:Serine beta-lactamase-like protein LACTB, mitochondrial n=1 Tax=Araneus ventricosus TaxID=182803 RepID=A0A4Y2DTP9_ARAVE|nr:Serine beta-lactamase-like protein LACTB, mitochondrial [Araneus ventricosus]